MRKSLRQFGSGRFLRQELNVEAISNDGTNKADLFSATTYSAIIATRLILYCTEPPTASKCHYGLSSPLTSSNGILRRFRLLKDNCMEQNTYPASQPDDETNPPQETVLTTRPTFQPFVVLPLAFISGFIIMSVELLGGRILAPYFGSSIYVWGSIITIFMLSLSIGYLSGGKLSLHNPNLRSYGTFFIVAALMLFPTIIFGENIMDWVFLRIEDPRYGSLVASTFLFFVPTAILGMIAPYSVRLLVESSARSGSVAGSLYFISTLGSALGTLATSFYFVLWFEVNTILISMCVTLTIAGICALIANRFS